MDKDTKKMEDRFFFRPKKRKPEVQLKDIFKNLKPAYLYHQAGGNMKEIEKLKTRIDSKDYNTNVFYLTNPFTRVTKKEAAFLFESYLAIQKLREKNKKVTEKIRYKKNKRIWPLPLEIYDRLAKKIYNREGQPTFEIRRIDGIVMGDPVTTFSNYIKGRFYSNPVIIKRLIGIKPIPFSKGIKLWPTIDVNAENELNSRRRR